MLRNTTSLLILLGGVALSLGVSITPIIREGSTDINTTPFIRIGNGLFYIQNSYSVNWFQAYESCSRMNATLISFDSFQKWNDIVHYLDDRKIHYSYWTSGTDLADEGRHTWFASGHPMGINLWAPGQPDNDKNNEHCDHLGHPIANSKNKKGMNDAPCLIKLFFICEAPQPYTASFVIWK